MTEQTKHDRIFIRSSVDWDSAFWFLSKQYKDDVEYIRADLVEEQLAAKDAELDGFTSDYTDAVKSTINELEQQLAECEKKLLDFKLCTGQLYSDIQRYAPNSKGSEMYRALAIDAFDKEQVGGMPYGTYGNGY
jgi:hypothetical protein